MAARWGRVVDPGTWPHRLRQTAAVLVVMNVALGLAFSVIGLRRQADEHTDEQLKMASWRSTAEAVRNDVWRSLADARPVGLVATLAHTEPDALPGLVPDGADHREITAAAPLVSAARHVRVALEKGDRVAARSWAARVDDAMTRLGALFDASVRRSQADSSHAGTIADIETVVLMLFAAGVGLLLFRRTVAVRLNGEIRAAEERSRAQARFTSLVHNSSDLISIVDAGSRIRFQTLSATAVLGHDPAALVRTELFDLVHPEDRARAIAAHGTLLDGARSVNTLLRMRAEDGTWRHIESTHNDVRDDPNVAGIVISSRDVSERVALESRLRFSAFHDDLTSLANRSLFADRVEHGLRRVGRDGRSPVVVFLDLDDFKTVNDTLGHAAGDELLVVIADRMQAVARPADTVARLGGDEFAVLIEDADDDEVLSQLRRISATLREPVVLDGHELSIHASLGWARGTSESGVESLLSNADLAMYAAKAAGKDTALPFTPELGRTAATRLRMKAELGGALDDGHIRAWYQPTLDLQTGRITGLEALARWEHPHRGVIPPLEFISIAEQTGQIVGIGRAILRQACVQLAHWREHDGNASDVSVSVNLSARELAEPDLVDFVRRTLDDTGLPPGRLILELTESVLVTEHDMARRQLADLRALGLRVAIDDFGTGYSSLAYLERLPVDIVKIDKAFVDRLLDGEFSPMINTITQMARALGLATVAEGIEHDRQAETLAAAGCDFGQGYLYSRPVRAPEVPTLLDRFGGGDTATHRVRFAPTIIRTGTVTDTDTDTDTDDPTSLIA